MAGDPFRPELAAAAADTSEAVALDALDALLRLDLVRQTEVPRRFRFRHPLVRRAVEKSTPAGWRLGAHERCAAALERQGASAAERAHHVALAGRQGDMVAVAVLREAGETAAQRAPASAAVWFGDALQAAARDGSRGGAGRAPARPRQGVGRDRAVRPGPLRDARELSVGAARGSCPAGSADDGVRRRRAPARPPRASPRPACQRDGKPPGSGVARSCGADDRAGDGRLLPDGLRADA